MGHTGRSKEECLTEAIKYKSRIEFKRSSYNIYYYARTHKWLDEICAHMQRNYPIQNVVYMWKAKDLNIWKIGTSNLEIVSNRISQVATKNDMIVETVFYRQSDDAKNLEKYFLSLGEKVDMSEKHSGHTEFRKYDETTLKNIIRSLQNDTEISDIHSQQRSCRHEIDQQNA